MLTLRDVRRRLGIELPAEGMIERLKGTTGVDEIPGVSELRSMCHNARTIAGLCDLLGVEGDLEREGQLIGTGELEQLVDRAGFILPPD